MEILVVFAVIGILLGFAMVRYVGVRRTAFVAEADESLGDHPGFSQARRRGRMLGLRPGGRWNGDRDPNPGNRRCNAAQVPSRERCDGDSHREWGRVVREERGLPVIARLFYGSSRLTPSRSKSSS